MTQVRLTSGALGCVLHASTLGGYTTGPGGVKREVLGISSSSVLCTVHAVTAFTLGFTVHGANVPMRDAPGQSSTLTFTVTSPPFGYHGELAIYTS